jgi:hypothetical protein
MNLSSFEEDGFGIWTMVAACRDDDLQPDIAEHPDGLGVFLPSFPSQAVVGIRPGTVSKAAKGELPHHFAQGIDAGTPKADGAGGAARLGDGGSPGLALGDGCLSIPVAVIAQFTDHPSAEKITSPRQAPVELAVRKWIFNIRWVSAS